MSSVDPQAIRPARAEAEVRSDPVAEAVAGHRPVGTRSPLADPSWSYVERCGLDQLTEADWRLLQRQRRPYGAEEIGRQALEMLAAQRLAPSFGYQINNYEHCLQSATRALQAGEDEETIVATLFHDVGFVVCNDSHGAFAAQLLRPWVSDRQVWMLERHMYFQAVHSQGHPDIDHHARERWRGHPHFDYAASWVAAYDVTTIDAAAPCAPLSDFEPMVMRLFSRPARYLPLPD